MTSDAIVIGAGVIGLGIAWRSAQRGVRVTVVDPAPGSGATWTAAGMLAAETELYYGERDLFDLALESARRYPAFAAELTDATGHDVGYLACGSVVAAWDAADLAGLRDLRDYGASLGRELDLVGGPELHRMAPALASGLPGGLVADNDHQVDNRRLHEALLVAAERSGVTLIRERVVEVLVDGGRATGVRTEAGTALAAGQVLLAAGAWSRDVTGIPAEVRPPVRPVKGQTVRLRVDEPLLTRSVRGTVKGSPVYVVPRADGEIVVGASSEEAGFDLRPRTSVVYELLRDAQSLVPALGEAEFVEVSTSLRPGTPDNAPILGTTALPGLLVATGHYRNGILLAPATADTMAELLVTGTAPELLAPFHPARFTGVNA